ncbi:MAG TPA: hypothetical protein EYP90_05410 [Chromatiaceae bacterium]|nr:hypothetical protein [Chromatiaceae bacterium]
MVHNITIKTNVVGASIYAGETKVGVTGPDKALTFQLEESIEEMQLAVKMRGRSTVYLRITPEGDLVRSVRLRERETPSRPRPGKTPSKRPMSDYALPD